MGIAVLVCMTDNSSILFTQLLATTIVSGVFKSVPAVQEWVQGNPWMMWVSLFSTIGVLIGLFIFRKKYPANFYLLGAFTYIRPPSP
jgi:protein lifeguard